jgi:hypothetical protein
MAVNDEDQKSITRSQASSNTSSSTNMAVIRFSALDEIMFASFWTFYKEKKLHMAFWLICMFWTVISSLAITFNFHNWPLWNSAGQIIFDFFLFAFLLFMDLFS